MYKWFHDTKTSWALIGKGKRITIDKSNGKYVVAYYCPVIGRLSMYKVCDTFTIAKFSAEQLYDSTTGGK